MKTKNKIAVSLFLGFGAMTALGYAQPGPANGMGPGMMRGMMGVGQMESCNANMKVMRGLMTPSERLSMMDKMIDAKSAEERQTVMNLIHDDMEKRAKEKGIALQPGHCPPMMSGKNCG